MARKSPNAWGLHDMHGNVWEWCEDGYAEYPTGSVTDPTGPLWIDGPVVRGGGRDDGVRVCRSAKRFWHFPGWGGDYVGFRLLMKI